MTNIQTIFTQDLENGGKGELGVDDKGTLYWNKKAIITEQKIKLSWLVNMSVVFASLSTVIIAIFTVMQYYSFSCNG